MGIVLSQNAPVSQGGPGQTALSESVPFSAREMDIYGILDWDASAIPDGRGFTVPFPFPSAKIPPAPGSELA